MPSTPEEKLRNFPVVEKIPVGRVAADHVEKIYENIKQRQDRQRKSVPQPVSEFARFCFLGYKFLRFTSHLV